MGWKKLEAKKFASIRELNGISAAHDGRALRAVQGLHRQDQRDPGEARRGRSRAGQPDLQRPARAARRPVVRDRRRQEPRDLLRPPRRSRAARRRQPHDGADQARLPFVRRVARRLQGLGPRRPRLGVAGLRSRLERAHHRGRRRAEHLPAVERHADPGARRLRARATGSTTAGRARSTSKRSSTTWTGRWSSRISTRALAMQSVHK